METKSGIIKKIIFKGGFGFIHQEDGSDIFFHKMGVIKANLRDYAKECR